MCIYKFKERISDFISTLPLQYLHKLIITNIIYFAVLWINDFYIKNGLSTKYSPRSIMIYTNLFCKHYKVVFGTYCEFHYETKSSKSMVSRMRKAIALVPTGNLKAAQKFSVSILGA